MDWEQLRERTLGEVGTALVTEGAGTAGGFVGAAFIGRQVQNILGQGDPAGGFASFTSAAMAWLANNAPKAAIWYFTKKYAIEPGETVTPVREAISDARKAFAGSIVFDTLMRISNGGTNPATAKLFGWQVLGSGTGQTPEVQKSMQADVQRLIQENSALRAELNKALQRLATPAPIPVQPAQPVQVVVPAPQPVQQPVPQPPIVTAPPVVQVQPVQQQQPPVVRYQPVTPVPPAAPVVRPAPVAPPVPVRRAEDITPYAAQPVPPAVSERERRYGFMENVTPPAVQDRQRKFGFMRGSGGEEKEIAAMFGML